jgi:transposase
MASRCQSRPQESEQDARWSFCLTAVTLVALAAIKGDRTLAQLAEQFDIHPNQITSWKAQLEGGASDVFGPGVGNGAMQPAVDVKRLHAKIGELTLENNFLEGALNKAGLLSARRLICSWSLGNYLLLWKLYMPVIGKLPRVLRQLISFVGDLTWCRKSARQSPSSAIYASSEHRRVEAGASFHHSAQGERDSPQRTLALE